MSADLHIHTAYSDSTLAPEEVLKIAGERGFKTIAIADHDILEGAKEALGLSHKYNIEVIPAVELSTYQNDVEVHILGYYIDLEDKTLNDALQRFREIRFNRAKKIIEKLKRLGIELDYRQVLEKSGDGAVGRLHIAKVLCTIGKVSCLKEAFDKYLGIKAPCYVKKFKLSPTEAIAMISEAGGIAVLAHPFLSKFDELIPQWIKCGLRGIEVYHPQHPEEVQEHYKHIAERYNLLITGGSDCHGETKGGILIGEVSLSDIFVDALRAEKEKEMKKSCLPIG